MIDKTKANGSLFRTSKMKSSIYDSKTKYTTVHDRSNRKNKSNKQKVSPGIIFGISLTFVTIILQCVALSTSHWKEITSNTHSLYVDGIDALLRTEILHYFNSVHRYSRHSYGLFHRCEYRSSNSSIYDNQADSNNLVSNKLSEKCTKNYLPSFDDDHFNQCHSLSYYRFCTKANEKNFNINNDYLHVAFDVSTSPTNIPSKFSCQCHYPLYVVFCQIFGILAIVCLCVTCLLFGIFSCSTNLHYHLKIKYVGMLSSFLSIILLMGNLIIIYKNFEHESVAYFIAIEKHYKSNQIYKLSEDAKIAIQRFISSINIRIGYSTIIAWIALALSIVDSILLLATCIIKHDYTENETCNSLISPEIDSHHNPLQFTPVSNDSQIQTLSPSLPPAQIPTTNNLDENISLTQNSNEERYRPEPQLNDDEV